MAVSVELGPGTSEADDGVGMEVETSEISTGEVDRLKDGDSVDVLVVEDTSLAEVVLTREVLVDVCLEVEVAGRVVEASVVDNSAEDELARVAVVVDDWIVVVSDDSEVVVADSFSGVWVTVTVLVSSSWPIPMTEMTVGTDLVTVRVWGGCVTV
jgi:hypothetical protein